MSKVNSSSKLSENILREILFIFFANKRIVIETIALIFFIVLAVAFLSPKEYTANATLLVKGKRVERNPAVVQKLQDQLQDITREDLNSEAEIIGSIAVIKATVIRLAKDTDIFSLSLDPETNLPIDEYNEERLTDLGKKLSKKLDVTLVRTSQILELTLVWDSPEDAEIILDTIINEYLNYRTAVYKPEKAKGFYNDTLKSYRELLDENSEQLVKLTQKIKAPNAEAEIESNLTVSEGFQLQLGDLELKRQNLTGDLNYFNKQLAMLSDNNNTDYVFFTNIENQSIREMANSVRVKLHEYRKINSKFLATSHRAKSKKEELDKAYTTFIKEVRSLVEHKTNQLQAVEDSIAHLKTRLKELDSRNINLAQYQIQLEELMGQKQLLEESFNNYYRLHEESKMQERTRNAAIDTQIIILTKTWASKDATFPNKGLLIPFGFVISVMLGLTVAFINEYFDNTFKRPVDTALHLDLPVIIAISDRSPKPKQVLMNKIIDNLKQRFSKDKPNKEATT
jgi:uncharacterized protein involved in exopolysaccharide biosynthesis